MFAKIHVGAHRYIACLAELSLFIPIPYVNVHTRGQYSVSNTVYMT